MQVSSYCRDNIINIDTYAIKHHESRAIDMAFHIDFLFLICQKYFDHCPRNTIEDNTIQESKIERD